MQSLRRFHNWVKAVTIEEALDNLNKKPAEADVIDVACGRGGDLLKWTRFPVRSYSGFDVSADALEKARERATRISNTSSTAVSFHIGDMCQPWPTIEGDVISCMFGPHFAYRTDDTAKEFWNNVRRSTASVFVCMFPEKAAIQAFVGDAQKRETSLCRIEMRTGDVVFDVFGSTPEGTEPLLSANDLRTHLVKHGFTRIVCDETPRQVRARQHSRVEQRKAMRCPQTLDDAQWALADLHRIIVAVRA